MKNLLVVFVILVLFGIGCSKSSQTQSQQTDQPDSKPELDFIKSGMYKVGPDVRAGEYIVRADGDAYFQIAKDSSGELDSIIANEILEDGQCSYIILMDGDYVTLQSCSMVLADGLVLETDINNIPPSMYKIGTDIPAGEYKLIPFGDGYWERIKNLRDQIGGIIANDIFTDPVYVTVQEGEYFKIQNADAQLVE
jgi:hypothetical protein